MCSAASDIMPPANPPAGRTLDALESHAPEDEGVDDCSGLPVAVFAPRRFGLHVLARVIRRG
jgi:hypothetical protein